jgi:hypothetical protein
MVVLMRHQIGFVVGLSFLALQFTSAQVTPQNRELVVNGKSGEATTVQINGRTYVDLETLTRIANGSLGFRGNQVTLVLPGADQDVSAATAGAQPTGLTQNFRSAAIETLAQMREWASAMGNAIQHGYPITENWASDYRAKAAASLGQAGASAAGDSDHNLLQLLTNEFQNVEAWSNELLKAKENMDTAKYSMSSDALRNEPLSQKIIQCGRSLASMLGRAQFADEPTCH